MDPGDDEPPHAVLKLGGDLDADGAAALHRVWDEADPTVNLIVVLDDAAFMDSAGLGALIAGVRRFREFDAAFLIATAKPALRRLFEAVGFDRTFGVVGSYAEALDVLREL